METLIDAIVKTLGGALLVALIALAAKLYTRMGIALTVERQQQLESAARQAVMRIEELAAAQLKLGLAAWNGPQKLSAAVTDIVDKLPRVDRSEAERIVQAVLPSLGLGATAVVVELGKALRTRR